MVEAVFWIALVVVAYVYVGYPALLLVWSRVRPRPVHPHPSDPPVSIVIAARNEGHHLGGRLDNLLSLDYPPDRIQVIVASDGSTDDTAEVLARYRDRATAILLPPVGKARALNAAVAAATSDILIFADARQRFAPDAIRALVAPLADPDVGGVCGELILDSESGGDDSSIGEGLGGYWRYEKWLRRHESLIGSTMGATGAIYALRRSLWQPLPPDTILDDVLAPMRAVLASSRVVFAAGACAFDSAGPATLELRRKIRTLAGNYQILWQEPRLLNPFANPVWVQYVSHKIGRLVVPWALGALLLSSVFLAPTSVIYAAAFAAQLGFYTLAAYGAVLDRRDRRRSAAGVPASPDVPDAPILMKGSRT